MSEAQAVSSTWCYLRVMSSDEQINQRDLRMRSREIMDGVERGESFLVTRDGRTIAELVPFRRPPRFVSRDDFARVWEGLPDIDPDRFRTDVDDVVSPEWDDPYAR